MNNQKSGGTDKIILGIIGGFILLIIVLIGYVAIGESKAARGGSSVVQYQTSDTEKPVAKASTSSLDLGRMKVSDEKSADFTVANTGTKPLQFFKISSSCGCTSGQITIKGVKSPEFTMHSNGQWFGSINPGETATVTVVYRPSIMPVKGDISRAVYVDTNDPANSQLTFTVKAFVE